MTGLIGNVFFWVLLVSLFGGYFTLRLANNYRDQAAFVEFPETPERYNRRAQALIVFFYLFLVVMITSLSFVVFQVLQTTRPQSNLLAPAASAASPMGTDVPAIPTETPERVFSTATPRPTGTPTPIPEPTNEVQVAARIGNTNYRGVNVRAIPSLEGDILARLVNRTEVEILDSPDVTADGYTWREIRLEDGTAGWVAEQFLIPYPTPAGR